MITTNTSAAGATIARLLARITILLISATLPMAMLSGCAKKNEKAKMPIKPGLDLSKLPGLLTCLPGPVNSKGVGKLCTKREDCAGQWASFCDVVVNKKRPPMCSRMCDDNTDCGENAYCGVINGVRHCYPKVCHEWKWTPGCEKHNPFCVDKGAEKATDEQKPKHKGALICAGGINFNEHGWGKRCDPSSREKNGVACKGLKARACESTFNPTGPNFCVRECWSDYICGDYGYCAYHLPIKSFSFCLPRCPEARHRAIKERPANIGVCNVDQGVIPNGKKDAGNPDGVGVRCKADSDCAGNSKAKTCGTSLGSQRKPDVCTMTCKADADCGNNALCVDVDFNVAGDGKAGGKKACVPACWAI